MTTTLRINEELYRQAKAAAAKEGVTLTRFIEEGLKLRISSLASQPRGKVKLHAFDSGQAFELSPEEIKTQLAVMDTALDAKLLNG